MILNKVIREGPSEKETLEHRREGGEKVGHVGVGTWEKRVLGRGKRKCKSPKTLVAVAD